MIPLMQKIIESLLDLSINHLYYLGDDSINERLIDLEKKLNELNKIIQETKNMNISYEIAVRALNLIALQGKIGHLASVGVSQVEFDKLTGSLPYVPADRNRMGVLLNAFLHLSCDQLGVPRFTLPVEYVAAGICVFIDPTNAQAICRIMERTPSASDLGIGGDSHDVCSAEQLFALVVQLYNNPASNQARIDFNKKTNLNLSKLIAEFPA